MISKNYLFTALLAFLLTPVLSQTSGKAKNLVLANKGKSSYAIRIDREPTPVEKRAFLNFIQYFKKISRVSLEPAFESKPGKDSLIWLVSPAHTEGLPVTIPWEKLGKDGFLITTSGPALIIAGGSEKGLIYGVAWFFEKYAGCRKYGNKTELIPKHPVFTVPAMNELRLPAFEYRSNHVKDPDYCEWYGLDRYEDVWGMYVHTFNKLIPPAEFFDEHPEYFSLLPGGRVPDAQLCLSNKEVLNLVIERLGIRMKLEPDKQYWSVSQNDTYSPCGCENCKKLDLAYGGPSGTMIWFVNQVAAAFPEKTISTLAYQYTRSAPLNIKPRDNVNIFLCSIECDRSKALTESPGGMSFVKDVRDWTKLTHNILLWDYIIQYRSMLSPFPNFPVLQPNLRFFADEKIKMVFEQGPSTIGHSEFSELRALLTARLLWNPEVNTDSIIHDFCLGFYGKGGPKIEAYIGRMNHELKVSGEELGIYGLPKPSEKGYLSAPNMQEYTRLFDEAEVAVKQVPIFRERVWAARLPLQYAILEQAKILGLKPAGFFVKDEKESITIRPDLRLLLDTFVIRCQRNDITMLHEMGNSPEEYKKNTLAFLNASYQQNLAYGLAVTLAMPASKKYHGGESAALTDGLCGLEDYNLNWLGWEGDDLQAIIDLGSNKTIKTMAVNFMQDNNSWIFMPLEVSFFVSENGNDYKKLTSLTTKTDARKPGYILEEFTHTFAPENARYIKIVAISQKTCPLWHKGAGEKSWIFADEIRIQ